MKIEKRIKKPESEIDFENLILEHLIACGVTEPEKWISANESDIQNPILDEPTRHGIAVLKSAIENQKSISVLADADFDGILSSAVMCDFLKKQNARFNLITHKGKKHGITKDAAKQTWDYKTELLIVPDAGTDPNKCAEILYNSGCTILVLDHHKPTKKNTYATIVNPFLQDGDLVNHDLSGTCVTIKFIIAYCNVNNIISPYYWDMGAASIVSDMCSIRRIENIAILRTGLNRVENEFLQFLYARLAKGDRSAKSVGWSIAPIANALTRVEDSDIELFIRAFLGEIDFTDAIHAGRQAKTAQANATKAMSEDSPPEEVGPFMVSFVDKQWAPYTGLYANSILGNYHKPTLVLREQSDKLYSGSMRSPNEIMDLLNSSKLCKVQGHDAAAGIIIKKQNYNKLIEWAKCQNELLADTLEFCDCDLSLKDIDIALVENLLEQTKCMCNDVPAPVFHIVLDSPKVTVYRKRTNTIKFESGGFDFLYFMVPNDMAEQAEAYDCGSYQVECLFELGINEYMGKKKVQAIIKKFEISNKSDIGNVDWDDIFK